jgi:hypothetical protein
LSQRQAKVNVNSFLRRARSLFSDKITRHLKVELPDPLPFSDVAFEPRQSLTEYFLPKSEDSIGDVQVDPELMEIFRADARKRATSGFGQLLSGPNEKVIDMRPPKEKRRPGHQKWGAKQ